MFVTIFIYSIDLLELYVSILNDVSFLSYSNDYYDTIHRVKITLGLPITKSIYKNDEDLGTTLVVPYVHYYCYMIPF